MKHEFPRSKTYPLVLFCNSPLHLRQKRGHSKGKGHLIILQNIDTCWEWMPSAKHETILKLQFRDTTGLLVYCSIFATMVQVHIVVVSSIFKYGSIYSTRFHPHFPESSNDSYSFLVVEAHLGNHQKCLHFHLFHLLWQHKQIL